MAFDELGSAAEYKWNADYLLVIFIIYYSNRAVLLLFCIISQGGFIIFVLF